VDGGLAVAGVSSSSVVAASAAGAGAGRLTRDEGGRRR